MTARQFFYLVCQMRSAQAAYFNSRDIAVLRAARMYERRVDAEITRVKDILSGASDQSNLTPNDITESLG